MSSKNPLVSVIIPNYNSEHYLVECLESVIHQDYRSIEIIVIDDGSTDNSLKVLEEYSQKIKVLITAHRGASAARNEGLRQARGDFIALLDSDDVWEKSKISKQMKLAVNHNLDLVYCSSREFYENGKLGRTFIAEYSGDCYDYYKRFPTRAVIVQGCSGAIFKKSKLQHSGVFDETFSGAAEDWDFFRRLSRVSKVGFCGEVLVHYRKHSASIMSRPLSDFFLGNKRAISKMFIEDCTIGLKNRISTWVKFYFLLFKASFVVLFQSRTLITLWSLNWRKSKPH